MVTDEQQWYVQKGSRVQGPYSTSEIGRYLLLGRVRNTDRVSRDGELWEPVTQVPELIPEELLDLDSEQGWNLLVDARTASDERELDTAVIKERRALIDGMPGRLRDEWSVNPSPTLESRQTVELQPVSQNSSVLPWSLLGLTLGVLAVVLYLNSAVV